MMESSLACFKTHKRTQSVLQIVLFLVNEKCAIQWGGGERGLGGQGWLMSLVQTLVETSLGVSGRQEKALEFTVVSQALRT